MGDVDSITHNCTIIVLVHVRLHIPNDLVGKQLRKLRCLNDVPFNVAKIVISQTLYDLWDVEECYINRMTFQCSHRVLDQERVVLVCRQEICNRCDWADGNPVEKVLQLEPDILRKLTSKEDRKCLWLRDDLGWEV